MSGTHKTRKPGKVSGAWIRSDKRWAIYARDGFVCVWCGTAVWGDGLCLDHLFPRWSRQRDNDERRIVTACIDCNMTRRDQPVAKWMRRLKLTGRYDMDAIYRRLQIARYVPVNRRAGARMLAKWRAERDAPKLFDPEDILY